MSETQEQPKVKYPRTLAIEVARVLVRTLEPFCERIMVAGSLRRMKPRVGDVEIVFQPKTEAVMLNLFEPGERSLVDPVIEQMEAAGVLSRRVNVLGHVAAWGPSIKLARHEGSGVPVDFFAATGENWWNTVVCRTGGAVSNIAICRAAIDRGWKWSTTGEGFSRMKGLGREVHPIGSEREVFEFVGLPWREPAERE